MRDVAPDLLKELDRVERLEIGEGIAEAFAFARGTPDAGSVGVGARIERRINENLAAFARGSLGHVWGIEEDAAIAFEALAGIRGRF